jgi:hypothetical protein
LFDGIPLDDFQGNSVTNNLVWKTKPNTPKFKGLRQEYLPTSRLYLGGKSWHSLYSLKQLSEEQLDLFFARTLQELWTHYFANTLNVIRKAQEEGLCIVNLLLTNYNKTSQKSVSFLETNLKIFS